MTETLTNIVQLAYDTGVLQYHPMTVCGLTCTLVIGTTTFNTLVISDGTLVRSIRIYDNDSEYARRTSIANLIALFDVV